MELVFTNPFWRSPRGSLCCENVGLRLFQVGVSCTSHRAEGTQAKGRISRPKLQGRQPGRNHSVPRRPSLSQVGFFGAPECSERRDGPKQAFRSRRVFQSGSCAGVPSSALFPFPSGVVLRFPPLPLKPHLLTQGFACLAGRSWVFLGSASKRSGLKQNSRVLQDSGRSLRGSRAWELGTEQKAYSFWVRRTDGERNEK